METMRHSCAHLVAAAVLELYPEAKFGVGPTVENGFYYDIDFPEPIGEEDLKKIEEKAKELAEKGVKFEKSEMSLEDAIKFFVEKGQKYKVELLKDLQSKGTTKVKDEELKDFAGTVDKATPRMRCCSASTVRLGRRRKTSTPICSSWKRRRSATIERSGRNKNCFSLTIAWARV